MPRFANAPPGTCMPRTLAHLACTLRLPNALSVLHASRPGPTAHMQVGVIQPHVELFGEDSCVVEWGNSRTAVYGIGFDDGFELVHLETSPTSGAPVVGKFWTGVEEGTCDREELLWEGRELERPDGLVLPVNLCGMPVERGTHWTYSEAEPGVGVIQDAGAAGQEEGAHVPAGEQLAG